ncbi:MAG: HAD-IIIC family phosphatase [Candidatus Korobacteraceae bacterium]
MNQAEHDGPNSVSVRIAANFTIEPIEEFLAYWLGELGIDAEIRFAPYNQVFQQLLEGGLLRTNRGGINLVALDLDAWLVEGAFNKTHEQLLQTIGDFVGVLRRAGAEGAGGAVILFPSCTRPEPPQERAAAIAAANKQVCEACASIAGWSTLDLSSAVSLYCVAETRDPFTDELGNIPFTEEMYVAAATAAARRIRSVRTKPRKVIVLDCDNTLWQGICGEGAVQVTPPYRKLHEFMLRQRDDGVLLVLASKNNEADAMAVLESVDSVLKPEHFTAWQINWQAKSESLNALSEELGLALNSFIFLDDSPYECMEVRNACPDVLTVSLPAESEAIPAFLEHLWAFDHPAATDEDRNRASMYQAERQRTDLSRQALTREEFLASLQIEIQIAVATNADLPRIAQLTQRTTQFNMTGVQHTVQSLAEKLAQPGNECWTVRVRDIFGDYGLVGAIVFETAGDNLRIDTLLLSCRALGRGVEDRMIADLKHRAVERGAERIVIPFVPTLRNRPALEFLSRLCEVPIEATDPFECVLSATSGSSEWRRTAVTAPTARSANASSKVASNSGDGAETLVRIAGQLQTARQILDAIRNRMKRRPVDAGPFVAPDGSAEEGLARIWSECLAVAPIGARDNFFDFGGQSLIATRILTKVRSEFGVKMSLTDLFDRPTVAEMAAHIASVISTGSAEGQISVSESK